MRSSPISFKKRHGILPLLTLGMALLASSVVNSQVAHKPGDLNDDGCVDLTDFNLMLAFFGGTPPASCPGTADIDGNGIIDGSDFLLFQNNYFLAPVACRPTGTPSVCSSYSSCDVVCESVCNLPDPGSGTVDLPPDGCTYLSPANFHVIVDSLPPGTELQVNVAHASFTNITRTPGGSLGGETETFDSEVRLQIHGTGALDSYERVLVMTGVAVEIDTAPKQPGQPTQAFSTDMRSLVGEILPADGDPDFSLLRITAGTELGMPSPGNTTLIETASFDVRSSFNVSYQIEMVGAAGGPLAGLNSTTTGTVVMGTTDAGPPLPLVPSLGVIGAGSLVLTLGLFSFWAHRSKRISG